MAVRLKPWIKLLFVLASAAGVLAVAGAGFALRWRVLEFSYVHTWRSREFEAQSGFDFGSLALRLQL